MTSRPPVNPSTVDFRAWKRRRDAARRCEPMSDGRRDPDGRPRFDPESRAYQAACEHLRLVLNDNGTPPAVRVSLAIVMDHEQECA